MRILVHKAIPEWHYIITVASHVSQYQTFTFEDPAETTQGKTNKWTWLKLVIQKKCSNCNECEKKSANPRRHSLFLVRIGIELNEIYQTTAFSYSQIQKINTLHDIVEKFPWLYWRMATTLHDRVKKESKSIWICVLYPRVCSFVRQINELEPATNDNYFRFIQAKGPVELEFNVNEKIKQHK